MMFFIIFTLVQLFNQNQVLSSPVLIWSNTNLPQTNVQLSTLPSLHIISEYICKLNTDQIQLRLFSVNDLTNEDIHRGSQSQHTIFLDAKNENSHYRYFPNVADDVYKTFSLIPQSNNYQCSKINFHLTSSTNYPALHDALNAMQASIDSINTNSDKTIVMALINGPISEEHSNRQRRDLVLDSEDVLISDDRSCMLYADKLYWETVNDQKPITINMTLDLDASSCVPNITVTPSFNQSSAFLNLTWTAPNKDSVTMNLMVSIIDRYWYLEKITLNGSEYRYFAYGMHSQMETPPTYSYVCTKALFVKYNSTGHGVYNFSDKFYIKNLQFQPFNGNGSSFGQANYCTSFFTSGIWMGITSSLLCLGILLFGIYRMMSIIPNDRFDDPKGKPLIIKAQE